MRKGEMDNILHNWCACLMVGVPRKRKRVSWHLPLSKILKLTWMEKHARRGGLAGISNVLRNYK